jgi:malate synthase
VTLAGPERTPVTADLVRRMIDRTEKELAEAGYEPELIRNARNVFEQVSLTDEFINFLTLPAYELLP